MSKRDGRQKSAQVHAEGQHGEKTHKRFLEQLHEGSPAPQQAEGETRRGGRRLAEGRIQHDEADRNSQMNRAMVDVQRGRLDPEDPNVKRGLNGSRVNR